MKKLLTLSALLLLSFQLSTATGIEWSSLSLEKAINKAKAEHKLVFVDVFATWCGPCKYLDKSVFPDKALGEFFNQHFISLEIDGERGEGPDLMSEFEVEAFPTLLFLDGEGKLIQRQVGALGAEALLKIGREVVDPTSSPAYQMQERFEGGERDRAFLTEYMQLLMDKGDDPHTVATAYLDSYSGPEGFEIDPEQEGDFMAFVFGIDDLEHPLMKAFLENIKEYIASNPDLVAMKIDRTFDHYMTKAVELGDPEIGVNALRTMYPALETVMDGEIAPIEEVEVKMRETLQEMMEEK